MLRTDITYVDAGGRLTQAGFQAFQEAFTSIAALQAVAISDAPGTAPRYACRAWVNFNGTGTPAIRASGNVASITDNGVGDYTINFTTAMPDADYVTLVTTKENPGVASPAPFVVVQNTGNVRIDVRTSTTSVAFDPSIVNVAIFR